MSGSVFEVIKKRAFELNIYTDELRGDSKAIKVFYGDRLDFVDKDLKKKEFILFLMNPQRHRQAFIELLRSQEPLDLDPSMAASYVKALLNDADLPYVEEAVDEAYTEISNVRERLQLLEVMDNEYISYGEDNDDDDAWLED